MFKKIILVAVGAVLSAGVVSSEALAKKGRGTKVEDNLPRHSGQDDIVGGVKLRGDGTVDDNSVSSTPGAVTTVKLRGDGTVDDGASNRRRRGR